MIPKTPSIINIPLQPKAAARLETIGPPIISAIGTATSALPSATALSSPGSQSPTTRFNAGKLGPSATPSIKRTTNNITRPVAAAVETMLNDQNKGSNNQTPRGAKPVYK